MISGEYFVLDGALALAVPTRLGQKMTVTTGNPGRAELQWLSYTVEGTCWFEARFALPELDVVQTNDPLVADRLKGIFQVIARCQPAFWSDRTSLQIVNHLEFPRLWGLGTSSTLLANIARWSQTDPYVLLRESFTGSGYDIACAMANRPVLYQVMEAIGPQFVQIPYIPAFADRLYFVYLETKQDSRAGITRYRDRVKQPQNWIDHISDLTLAMIRSNHLADFEKCLLEHEQIVSRALSLPMVKESRFTDYWGQIKSLGAWGGDFILATSERSDKMTKEYFNEKGYSVVLPYKELLV